jgi:hypothetical protein
MWPTRSFETDGVDVTYVSNSPGSTGFRWCRGIVIQTTRVAKGRMIENATLGARRLGRGRDTAARSCRNRIVRRNALTTIDATPELLGLRLIRRRACTEDPT